MKPRVLFVTSIYHVGERVYPVIDQLVKEASVTVLCLDRMSPKFSWQGDLDPREELYAEWTRSGVTLRFDKEPNPHDFAAIFFEDSWLKKKFHMGRYAHKIRKCSTPRISAPHGMGWHFPQGPFFSTHFLGDLIDHAGLFGKEEADHIKVWGSHFLGGIPRNDTLTYVKVPDPEYILVLAGWLPSSPHMNGSQKLTGKYSDYRVLNGDDLIRTGVVELSKKLGLPIVISQKTRPGQSLEDRKVWQPLEDYRLVNDHRNHDDMVRKAAAVIGAPTTLSIKPMALGIPTILFRHRGVHGHLERFPGLVDATEGVALSEYDRQVANPDELKAFAEAISTGVTTGRSTEIYVKEIMDRCR